jgi:hypothetical protein
MAEHYDSDLSKNVTRLRFGGIAPCGRMLVPKIVNFAHYPHWREERENAATPDIGSQS